MDTIPTRHHGSINCLSNSEFHSLERAEAMKTAVSGPGPGKKATRSGTSIPRMNTHGLPFQLSSFGGKLFELFKLSHFWVTHNQTVSIVIWDLPQQETPKLSHRSFVGSRPSNCGQFKSHVGDFSILFQCGCVRKYGILWNGNFNGNRLNREIFGELIFRFFSESHGSS